MASNPEKKSRPLHFYTDMGGDTVCGKSRMRCRSTSNLATWDSPLIADGRRCPDCDAFVASRRPKPAGREGA